MTSTIQRKINKPIHLFIGTLIIVLISVFGTPLFVNAQTAVKAGTPEFGNPVTTTYTLLEPLPCITGVTNCAAGATSTPAVNIQTYIVYIFELMIALAVLAAVVMCIVGGFEYMLTESVTTKLNAKATIENAILGLAGALGSWLILYTINPNLVNVSIVTVRKLNVSTTTINMSPADVSSTAAGIQAAQALKTVAALDAQAQDTLKQENDILDQLDKNKCVTIDDSNNVNLVPNASAACQTQYNQWLTAKTAADTAQSTDITSSASSFFSTQTTASNGVTDTGTLSRLVNNDTMQYNSAMAQLKANNDIAGEQALNQSYYQSIVPIENQEALLNYAQTPYTSQSQINTAKTAVVDAINANDAAAINNITDPAIKKQIANNGSSQIKALEADKNSPIQLTPQSSLP